MECREIEGLCPLEEGTPHRGEPLDLARMLLSRGRADEAARLVAAEALISAEAAEILADALEALGDPQGASRARERAATLEGR